MSVEIHCPKCGKLIKAPDEAGGKHGKCPYCKGKVYVPMPETEILGIAPIDEEGERREAELRRESARYAASVAGDKSKAAEGASAGGGRGRTVREEVPGQVVDIGAEVTGFIIALRDGELEKADAIVERLKRAGSRARDHVGGLILDEMPPTVKNVPPPVLKGFLKQLQGRL